jgi:hypothetical protein
MDLRALRAEWSASSVRIDSASWALPDEAHRESRLREALWAPHLVRAATADAVRIESGRASVAEPAVLESRILAEAQASKEPQAPRVRWLLAEEQGAAPAGPRAEAQ